MLFSSHRLLLVRCHATMTAARRSSQRVRVPVRWITSSVSVHQTPPGSATPGQPSSPAQPPSAWSRLKTMIKAFTNGSKLIFKDFRRMREIKRRANGFFPLTAEKLQLLSSGEIASPVTREEFVFMVNTSRDVRRALPTIVLFFVPFLGYFAPVLAFAFPQYLLSSHFLTEEQKDDVIRKGLDLDTEAVLKLSRTKLHLSKLPNSHLRLACSAWGFTSLLPPLLPRRKLQQQISNIFIADVLTKVEGGVCRLSEEEVEEACQSRCMFDAGSNEERAMALEGWVADTTAKGLKHSYLCHLPLWITKKSDTN